MVFFGRKQDAVPNIKTVALSPIVLLTRIFNQHHHQPVTTVSRQPAEHAFLKKRGVGPETFKDPRVGKLFLWFRAFHFHRGTRAACLLAPVTGSMTRF